MALANANTISRSLPIYTSSSSSSSSCHSSFLFGRASASESKARKRPWCKRNGRRRELVVVGCKDCVRSAFYHIGGKNVKRGETLQLIRRAKKGEGDSQTKVEEREDDILVKLSIGLLKFYKREISPLLPPNCRYLPTCSEYAMDAYKEFGFAKGTVLTAWRLFRCNPWGGKGYDPPQWPPVWR